jgi:hypothetical protein
MNTYFAYIYIAFNANSTYYFLSERISSNYSEGTIYYWKMHEHDIKSTKLLKFFKFQSISFTVTSFQILVTVFMKICLYLYITISMLI